MSTDGRRELLPIDVDRLRVEEQCLGIDVLQVFDVSVGEVRHDRVLHMPKDVHRSILGGAVFAFCHKTAH